jgi:DNA-binding SARP family transcriptional activator
VVGSAVTALVVFAAVPAVLALLVGDPLGGGLGHGWGHTARLALSVLALVAWAAWAACSGQLIRSVTHQVRRGQAGLALDARWTDRVAARIAVGILAMTTISVPVVVAGTNAGAATVAVAPRSALAPTTAAPSASPMLDDATTAAYMVKPGDSLWSIAQSQLGDGADWTEIAALNIGHSMAGGEVFVDPSLIHAGWTLVLPTNQPGVATTDIVVPLADPTPPPPPQPSVTTTTSTTPITRTSPSPSRRTPDQHSVAVQHHHPVHRGDPLPELGMLGIGAVACAALARRARRRRLLDQLSSQPITPVRSAPTIDTDIALEQFRDVPALDAFERANVALARALAAEGLPVETLGARAICVGTFGVEFWCAPTAPPPPPGFELFADGRAWRVAHGDLRGDTSGPPAFPVVLPVGDDQDGTWLVPVPVGVCLPLLGPAAPALCNAVWRAQESWAWAEMVTVTQDPVVADRETRAALGDDLAVLYIGDPSRLAPGTAALASVVTLATGTASDLTVLVDDEAASLHPLARTVRPHLMADEVAARIDELVQPVPRSSDEADSDPDRVDDLTVVGTLDHHDVVAHLEAGQVEVKLLTATPHLEGLAQPLPANRERRATELIAYLALHRPDAVTSDRLRTRVLGSGDADAAAKTLFNIATAARRALGTDDADQPLFPPGSRTGRYHLTEAVTVDAQRAISLAAAGCASQNPEEAMALLRAALDLIDGEPMANVLTGYLWWESEGHGGRIAAALVRAAVTLADLAIADGLIEMAHGGIEQARLVDPYSEALSRAAMQVAAAAGDGDRLRHEWRECQRRIDELDPGSTPSLHTERLYSELAREVLV